MSQDYKFQEKLSKNGIFYRLYESSHDKNKEKPPLVMVMGYGGSLFSWPLSFIEELSLNQKVLIFDNRGIGRSTELKSLNNLLIKNLTEDLHALVEELNFKRINLFGYSMGGCIALDYALANKNLVNKLIIQSSTAGGSLYTGPSNEIRERFANPQGNTFEELFFDFFELCMDKESIKCHRHSLDLICNNSHLYPANSNVLQAQRNAMRNFDFSKLLPEIEQETLIIHGKKDQLIPLNNGLDLNKNISNSILYLAKNSGHCPHIEESTKVLNCIENFLN